VRTDTLSLIETAMDPISHVGLGSESNTKSVNIFTSCLSSVNKFLQ
jgi:hypothetical protein